MNLKELTAEKMRPLTGDRFTTSVEDGKSVELTLDDVVVVVEKHVSSRLTRDSFALFFSGPKDVLLNQGTYSLEHPTLGTMAIFLVPKRRLDSGAYEFEAIFT